MKILPMNIGQGDLQWQVSDSIVLIGLVVMNIESGVLQEGGGRAGLGAHRQSSLGGVPSASSR